MLHVSLHHATQVFNYVGWKHFQLTNHDIFTLLGTDLVFPYVRKYSWCRILSYHRTLHF